MRKSLVEGSSSPIWARVRVSGSDVGWDFLDFSFFFFFSEVREGGDDDMAGVLGLGFLWGERNGGGDGSRVLKGV